MSYDYLEMPPYDYLHEVYYYEDGCLYYKKRVANRIKVGDKVGGVGMHGYYNVSIKGRRYKLHRIVYYFHHGVMPDEEIDHIDRDKSNNRIENLRVVTRSENISNNPVAERLGFNQRKDGKTTTEGKALRAKRARDERMKDGAVKKILYYFITHKDKTVDVVLSSQLRDYCEENDYEVSKIYLVNNGTRDSHKDIISVQRQMKSIKGE